MTSTSSADPDPTRQWDTKRKLFSLAEVRALPSAVLRVELLDVVDCCEDT